ncbi:MAG: hypothetical protein Alpg2KO_31750 [Alphaproteobacteria bacterium]
MQFDRDLLPNLVEVSVDRRKGGPTMIEPLLKHIRPTPAPRFIATVTDPIKSTFKKGDQLTFTGSHIWSGGFMNFTSGQQVLLWIPVPLQSATMQSFGDVGPSGGCPDARNTLLTTYRKWQAEEQRLLTQLPQADLKAALELHDRAAFWQNHKTMAAALAQASKLSPADTRVTLRQQINRFRHSHGRGAPMLVALTRQMQPGLPAMLASPNRDEKTIGAYLAITSGQSALLNGTSPILDGEILADLMPTDQPYSHRYHSFGKKQPPFRIDNADLSAQDLSNAKFHSIELTKANLNGTKLGHSSITNSSIMGAKLLGADLRKTTFSSDTNILSNQADCSTLTDDRRIFNILELQTMGCSVP